MAAPSARSLLLPLVRRTLAVASSLPATRADVVRTGTVPMLRHARCYHQKRRAGTAALAQVGKQAKPLGVAQALPMGAHTVKVVFSDDQACELNYIWLRDNCSCPQCIHPDSKQKLVDSVALDYNVRPVSMEVSADGNLEVTWGDSKGTHQSSYEPLWLYRNARSYMLNPDTAENLSAVPPQVLWDRVLIWKTFPEVSYKEFMDSDDGLYRWLDYMHKFGVVVLRGAPTEKGEILNAVRRVAYVKSTIWGDTFDVICEPIQTDPGHLAYTGMHLELHTDMNYRENSPGMQMLHCLKAMDVKDDVGGKSFFVDGFMVANWLAENNPAAFHILSSTPVVFSIFSHNMRYSQTKPVICVNKEGMVSEIHYNNRTLAPVQTPPHLVAPFYHALKEFAMKMRDPNSELCFNMKPGDLVAFNNRRVLHGRTSFDPTKVTRHLQGCYADIDEVFTKYRAMHAKRF
ncbi:gamma-butyrobetaine dioxygenase-like [Haemaphysalis longicornis]